MKYGKKRKLCIIAFFITLIAGILIIMNIIDQIERNHFKISEKDFGTGMEQKQLNSIPLHYFIGGETGKPLMLFIHPAFADHRTFDKQMEYFSKSYRIITIDLIGHGLSQGIKSENGIEYSAEHIKEIMEIEGFDKVNLVGVSIGALIAQDFANKFPDMVLSLCVTGGYDINNYDKSIEKQQRKQQLFFILKAVISMKWFSKSNALQTVKTPDAQKEFYRMNILFKRSSFKYMTKLDNIMNKYETADRNYPLLILCGEGDIPLSKELSKKWSESEKNSEFYTIENAGHCANMDNPKKFNELLKIFLENVKK